MIFSARGCQKVAPAPQRVWGEHFPHPADRIPNDRLCPRVPSAHLLAVLTTCLTVLLSSPARAQSAPQISYSIALTNPGQHLAEIQIILPPGPGVRELQLPVWNALYQLR